MGDLTGAEPPRFIETKDGRRLAVRFRGGHGPALLFLPGYASDMMGGKALALDGWAERTGHAMIRFDYSGTGESDGAFEEGTLARWRDDALAIVDACEGDLVVVGSKPGTVNGRVTISAAAHGHTGAVRGEEAAVRLRAIRDALVQHGQRVVIVAAVAAERQHVLPLASHPWDAALQSHLRRQRGRGAAVAGAREYRFCPVRQRLADPGGVAPAGQAERAGACRHCRAGRRPGKAGRV